MTPQERIALLDKQLELLAKKSETADDDHLNYFTTSMVSICNVIQNGERINPHSSASSQ